MITIVTIDEAILDKAARVAGIRDKAALVRRSLESLIAGESARRLAALRGSEAGMANIPGGRVEAEEIRDERSDSGEFCAGRERAVTGMKSMSDAGGNGR